jgi:hypothetical protein
MAGLSTAHTPANCHWSRTGYRLSFVSESDQPEAPWVCVREPGIRRPLTDSECAYCEFWEPTDEWTAVEVQRTAPRFWPE